MKKPPQNAMDVMGLFTKMKKILLKSLLEKQKQMKVLCLSNRLKHYGSVIKSVSTSYLSLRKKYRNVATKPKLTSNNSVIKMAKKIFNKKDNEMNPLLFAWGLMLYAIAIIYMLIGVYFSVIHFGLVMLLPFIIVLISLSIDFAIGYRNYRKKKLAESELSEKLLDVTFDSIKEEDLQKAADNFVEKEGYPGKIKVKKL